MTREEVAAVLPRLSGRDWLMASLMYGAGMRVMGCLRLRIKDVEFGLRQIMVRDGKGQKDRVVPLPDRVVVAIQERSEEVRRVHAGDAGRRPGRGFAALCAGAQVSECGT